MPRKPQIQLQAESKFPSKDSCQILLLKKASSSGRRLGAALAAGKTLHQRSFWPVCRCTSVPGLHESEENTNEEEEQSFSNPFGLIICFGVVDKDQLVNLWPLRVRDDVNMHGTHETPVSASLANRIISLLCQHVEDQLIAFYSGFRHSRD